MSAFAFYWTMTSVGLVSIVMIAISIWYLSKGS